jgi:HlyD family secretion protein
MEPWLVQAIKKNILAIILTAVCTILGAMGVLYLVRAEESHHYLTLYGNVDVRQVDIGFRVAGQVKTALFEEGDFVRQGSLMAELDRTPYDDQVRQAAANLDSIKTSLKNAQLHLQRRKELITIGGVSQEDLDNAQASFDESQANLYAAEAALAIARDNLQYTKTFCPTDGTILSRIREPGTIVNPADPVYTLSVASPVWIRAYVDEPKLGFVHFGMDATIQTDTEGGPVYTGKVGFISPLAEFTPKTVQTTNLRTDLVYRLRIYVDNPDHLLKQGMPITVKLKKKIGNPGD